MFIRKILHQGSSTVFLGMDEKPLFIKDCNLSRSAFFINSFIFTKDPFHHIIVTVLRSICAPDKVKMFPEGNDVVGLRFDVLQ